MEPELNQEIIVYCRAYFVLSAMKQENSFVLKEDMKKIAA